MNDRPRQDIHEQSSPGSAAAKEVALPESAKEVEILVSSWFDSLQVTDDFLTNREQPADQIRGPIDR